MVLRRKAAVFKPPEPTDSISIITRPAIITPTTPTPIPTPTQVRRVAKAQVVGRPRITPTVRPPERVEVRPSRIVQKPTGELVEFFPQIPREFIGAPRPTPKEGQVLLVTPETFRREVTKEVTPEGIRTVTTTREPFTLFSFAEAARPPTPEQIEIQRRRELLGTVTTPRDIGAFGGFAGLIFTRPEARAVAFEEFGAGFASPFVELGETVQDISRLEFEGRVREQPTFLSDLISVGGAQIEGFFGGDEPTPDETFEALLQRQEAKTPQRVTGEILGEAALTIGTLGVGKAIQVGIKTIPTGIRTISQIFKGFGKTGLPKFNLKAVQGATKTKTESVLKKELGSFNKKVNTIDKKIGKLDKDELKVNRSRFLSASQKKKKLDAIKKKRKKLDQEEKELRQEADKFTGLVRQSAIAKAPAERIPEAFARIPKQAILTQEDLVRFKLGGRVVKKVPRETKFTQAELRLGKGIGKFLDDTGKGFGSFTGKFFGGGATRAGGLGFREIRTRGGMVLLQKSPQIQKIRLGTPQLKQISKQVTKQEQRLKLNQLSKQQLKQAKKVLTKQKAKLKQAQKTIKKRKLKRQSADVGFEQVFRFPRGAVRPRPKFDPPPHGLITIFEIGQRKLQRQKFAFAFSPFTPVTTKQTLIPFQRAVQKQKLDVGFLPAIRTTPKTKDALDIATTPITTTKTTRTDVPFGRTTRARAGIIFPFLPFGSRRRKDKKERTSKLGARLFDIADEPFGEVEVGLGFFIEQKRPSETIAEAIGTADISFGEPITRQERQARERLGVNRSKRGRRSRNNNFTEGIDLGSFFG